MRSSKIAVFIIVILIIGIILVIIFLVVERPLEVSSSKYSNANILVYDEHKNQIESDYILYVDNTIYKSGKTLYIGAILNKVPGNSTFYVKAYRAKFYDTISKKFISYENESYRVELILNEVGSLNVEKLGNIGIDNITLILKSNKLVKNIFTCVKWSYNVLKVNLNYSSLENPVRFKSYDKCYDLNVTLKNSEIRIPVDYVLFSKLSHDDYIQFVFADREQGIDKIAGYNEDIGMEDYVYTIKA